MSFADRLLRKRRGLDAVIGFNGGSLQDQLDRGAPPQEPQRFLQQGDVTPPVSAATKTALYSDGNGAGYNKSALDAGYAPPRSSFQDRLMRPRRVFQGGDDQTRDRRTQPRDMIADKSQYLTDLENKPLSTRDKIGMVVQGISQVLGNEHPLPTRRQRTIGTATNQLGRELAIQKAQTAQAESAMVPFQLPDGTITQVPAKSAGALASRQQGQQGNLSIRRQQMDSHNQRWDTMADHEAAQDAQRLYNSGAADDNEDLRDEIAKRMRLPVGTKLPPSAQGQLAVDGNGNYILVNKRSGVITQPTQTVPGASPQPVSSMQKTNEQGRNRRFETGQTNANVRAANIQSGQDRRAAMRQGTTRKLSGGEVTQRTNLIGAIEDARQKMFEADRAIANPALDADSKQAARAKRIRAQNAGRLAAAQLNSMNAGYEAGPGDDFPYYKPVEQQAAPTVAPALKGRTMSQKNFDRYKKDHGDAAAQQLLDGGVTIKN